MYILVYTIIHNWFHCCCCCCCCVVRCVFGGTVVTVMYWRPTSQLCGQWLASLRWMAAGEYFLVSFPPLENRFTLSLSFSSLILSHFFSLSLSCNPFFPIPLFSLSPLPFFLSMLGTIFLLYTFNLSALSPSSFNLPFSLLFSKFLSHIFSFSFFSFPLSCCHSLSLVSIFFFFLSRL